MIATIHQPSSETFKQFQSCYLLAKGMTVYNSSLEGIKPYFATLGHHSPEDYNTADFVMFIMQQKVCWLWVCECRRALAVGVGRCWCGCCWR